MAQPLNRSILLARAVGALNRAAGFAVHFPAAAQIDVNDVELEARNLRAWLSGVAGDQALSDVEARLAKLSKRLDDLEDTFRA